MMFANLLTLSRSDLKILKVVDEYSIHRVVYDFFEDIRADDEKNASISSGLLYVDKGGNFNKRQILILSNRLPKKRDIGSIVSKPIREDFLSFPEYKFELVVNPTKRDRKTGKLIAIRTRQEIAAWFLEKASSSYGFDIKPESLIVDQLTVNQFHKSNHHIVQARAKLSGELIVLDRQLFIHSFKKGIGRGRAFGFGLLQITPI